MFCALTSLHQKLHAQCESDRRKDVLYCMLLDRTHTVRSKLVAGINKLAMSHSEHPALVCMFEERTPLVDKAIILAALAIEPDFFGYVSQLDDVCASALSELVANTLPHLFQSVLNGNLSIPEFVLQATRAYVRL